MKSFRLPSGGAYSSECISDCKDTKALCAFDYGCDRTLLKVKKEVNHLDSLHQLYNLRHEEWQTVYDGLCPKYD